MRSRLKDLAKLSTRSGFFISRYAVVAMAFGAAAIASSKPITSKLFEMMQVVVQTLSVF